MSSPIESGWIFREFSHTPLKAGASDAEMSETGGVGGPSFQLDRVFPHSCLGQFQVQHLEVSN